MNLSRHRLGSRIRPLVFFRNNFFIAYCIDMELGTPLRASIWHRLMQKKNQNRPDFFIGQIL